LGVTPPEAALFNVIHYGLTNSPPYLPASAASPDYSLTGPVTEGECRDALASGIAKGWLQLIDETALVKITDDLRAGQFIGPIYGLPAVGGVDFTHAGAELWQRICGRCSPETGPPDTFTDMVHNKTTGYFRTRAAALAAIADVNRGHAVNVIGPARVGPWRIQWWRRFSEGYRVDIEERMQWQGRGGGGGAGCVLPHFREKALPRLRHVLDRHNVALAEWLLFEAMEGDCHWSASDLPKWTARSATERFGVTASEDECRAGLEACLRNRWLRVVDQHALNEVQALLQEDRTLLSLSGRVGPCCGKIDFTPGGAALYRMICAEWLGPDWEDELSVWNDYYREVHHYCEAQEGLRGIVHTYVDEGEAIRASKLVPIGPWCVYWWERFPAGYRLELQIGHP
jgi:hypothetical protein